VYVPSVPARGDSCGAGDRFSAAVAGALRSGLPLDEAVVNAVHAAAEYVAADGPAGLVLESSRTPLEVS
jgi:hydroxymethylpyrimidine/phosphomethylpyrimidine kinase